MRKSLGFGLTAVAVIGTVLTPTAGWARVTSAPVNTPAAANTAATAHTPATANAPAGGDPNTTVTFAVNIGSLSMTAPLGANLGSGNPGTTISGSVGPNEVTDNRAALAASWTVTVSSTDFTTHNGTTPETIPAGDASYNPGSFTNTGTVTPVGTNITALSGGGATAVTATGVGVDTVTWTATEAVAVPPAAVGGAYTSTLTQSVL